MTNRLVSLPSSIICSGCGSWLPVTEARFQGWLFGQLADGRFVMRCPKHSSAHARRSLGLPGRVAVSRVKSLLLDQDRMLSVTVDGVRWCAWAEDCTVDEGDREVVRFFMGARPSMTEPEEFVDVPALALAMCQVADLRTWVAQPV